MRTDRGVNTHSLLVLLNHCVVQRIAHAMQTLELEVAWCFSFGGQRQHAANGVRVMAGELRIDHATGVLAQQVTGARQVRGVGAFFAGEYWVVIQTLLLGVLDFSVPVRAFNQAQRHLRAQLFAQQRQPYQHRQAALGVSLHHQTNLAPTLQGRRAQEFFVQLQRQL